MLRAAGQRARVLHRGAAGQHPRAGDDHRRRWVPHQGVALVGARHRAGVLVVEAGAALLQGQGQRLGELGVGAADGAHHAVYPHRDRHLAAPAELVQDEDQFLSAAQGEGGDEHLAAGRGYLGDRIYQAALLGSAIGVQPAAIGALDHHHVRPEVRQARRVHGALGGEGDVAGEEKPALVAFQADHRRAGDVPRRVEGGGHAPTQGHARVERHRHERVHQFADGQVIKEGQFPLLIQARLHDAARIGVQHAGEGDGDRRGVDGTPVALGHQFQGAGVVGMRVRNEDGIQTAGGIHLAEVRQLVAGQAPARLRRQANAGIHQQPPASNLHQRAAGPHFIRAAQKGNAQ